MSANASAQYLSLKDDLWHECLEESYGFLRASWQGDWLGIPAVLGHCLRFLNPHENHFSKAASSMLDAAQTVAVEIENQTQTSPNLTEPKYHNRLHFADALTSMSILLSILFNLEKKVNHDWMACALLTCVAHDFFHPGKVNRVESEIEKQTVNFLKPILSLHLVPDEWQNVITTAIVRSDFAIVHRNHANVSGKTFEWDLNWLCVLLNEADVMASASSRYGPELGESLAQELRLIDFQSHASVASVQGRINFLKQLLFSSPASSVLGLNQRVYDEIQSFN